jgi:hypothetical protein
LGGPKTAPWLRYGAVTEKGARALSEMTECRLSGGDGVAVR